MARQPKKDDTNYHKVLDEHHVLKKKQGGGKLVLELYQSKEGKAETYRFAYINGAIFQGDNGRVLGYDNAHGEHHRHYFGEYQVIEFTSIEEIIVRFEDEWRAIADEHSSKK